MYIYIHTHIETYVVRVKDSSYFKGRAWVRDTYTGTLIITIISWFVS